MMDIGIIGAGTAGLHLGLRLLARGIPVTLYAERDPQTLRTHRLPGTVSHHAPTRARERQLGVNHWDSPDFGMFHVSVNIGGPQPFGFRGYLEEPSLFVDYRLYQPRLAEDFVARGGHLVVSPMGAEDLERLARKHALVVVATGRSGLAGLFPRIPERSPFTQPQRLLFAGLARGIWFPQPTGMYYSVSPGHGELFESQMLTHHGRVTSFLIEALPGGALEPLATRKYEEDPRGFDAMLLALLSEHAPDTFSRVDPVEFGLLGPMDVLQGAVTPVVRRGYAALGEGRYVLALGDAHVTNDPLGGQGANAASGAAFALADAISEALTNGVPFDEDFCRRAEARTWAEARASTEWTNAMLQPMPPAHLLGVLVTASGDPGFADVAVNTLFTPERALETFATAESTAAFIARHSASARAGAT